MYSTKSSLDFSEFTKHGDFINLNLTIYYLSPFILTRAPVSVDDLIHRYEDHKIVINCNHLEEHAELFDQIINADLVPVAQETYLNARIYYVFKTKKDKTVLSVAMWGSNNSMFVNGIEIKRNDVFCDIIIPFLPEDAVKNLERYLGRGNQD